MTTFVGVLSLIVCAALVATLAAVLRLPGVFDRIIGIGMMGTKTIVLLAFTGVLFGRLDGYVDMALTYALLNFIGTLAVAKYLTRRESVPE